LKGVSATPGWFSLALDSIGTHSALSSGQYELISEIDKKTMQVQYQITTKTGESNEKVHGNRGRSDDGFHFRIFSINAQQTDTKDHGKMMMGTDCPMMAKAEGCKMRDGQRRQMPDGCRSVPMSSHHDAQKSTRLITVNTDKQYKDSFS